jgi:hypothetical protein
MQPVSRLGVSSALHRPYLDWMTNTQKSYIRLEKLSKDQLRTMLAEALRNTGHIEPVQVPANKRSLPTRQNSVAGPGTGQPIMATSENEATRGQKKHT